MMAVGCVLCQRVWLWQLGVVGSPCVWWLRLDFFFPYGFFLLEKDIQDHGLAWKFSQDHDDPEIYNTKIQ